jgi:hypothetical protein
LEAIRTMGRWQLVNGHKLVRKHVQKLHAVAVHDGLPRQRGNDVNENLRRLNFNVVRPTLPQHDLVVTALRSRSLTTAASSSFTLSSGRQAVAAHTQQDDGWLILTRPIFNGFGPLSQRTDCAVLLHRDDFKYCSCEPCRMHATMAIKHGDKERVPSEPAGSWPVTPGTVEMTSTSFRINLYTWEYTNPYDDIA